jgi:hypothetical protein
MKPGDGMKPNERRDILGELFRGEHGLTESGLDELYARMNVCLAPRTFSPSATSFCLSGTSGSTARNVGPPPA